MESSSEFNKFLERKRFALLDGVRAIAILSVIWHHSSGVNPADFHIFSRGYLGVDLFFVMSGFLITHLLIKEQRTNNCISLKQFYIRRTLRIFPLYYGYLAFMVGWGFLTDKEKFEEILQPLPYYLFYISNWTPEHIPQFFHRAWSLAVEEQFYLVWPILVIMFGFVMSARFIVGITFFILAGSLGWFGVNAVEFSNDLVPYRTILIGCLTAILLNYERTFNYFRMVFKSNIVALVLLSSVLLSIGVQRGPILGLGQLVVHLLMALFLAACVLNENNILARFLKLKLVQKIGMVSYGMYILHSQFWGVAQWTTRLIPIEEVSSSRITFCIVLTVISLCVSLLSYYTYERFFLNIKDHYKSMR